MQSRARSTGFPTQFSDDSFYRIGIHPHHTASDCVVNLLVNSANLLVYFLGWISVLEENG